MRRRSTSPATPAPKSSMTRQINMHRAIDLPAGLSLAGARPACGRRAAVDRRQPRTRRGCALPRRRRAGPPRRLLRPTIPARAASPIPIRSSPASSGKDFVDFDEDLQAKDIVNTVADGYDDIQLVKRYSTAGLGPSQGRHANLNTIRIVAEADRQVAASDRHHDLPPAAGAGEVRRARRPRLRAGALTAMHHRHVEPARR